VDKAERQVTAKELTVRQKQLDVQAAEDNLGQIADVKKAQDVIDDAEYALKFATSMLSGEVGGVQLIDHSYWSNLKILAQQQLAEAQQDLQDILNGSSVSVSSDVALQVAEKQLQVEQSQMQLEDAEQAVEDAKSAVVDAQLAVEDANQAVVDAKLDVDDAEQSVEDAREDVQDAQEALDEALDTSLEIIAPFAGFITRVNVEGGDEVLKGTVAVQLADPNKFEADIMVSEMDILQVKVGGEAWVQVDAMSGMNLPAEVTHISPTATIQSGVVNYVVKVEVQSLEGVAQERQAMRQQMMEDFAAGQIPERLQQAIDEGRITQEQVEAMMEQGPPEGMTPPEGTEFPQGMSPQQQESQPSSQVSAAIPEDFQLREGLTVTVSVIVEDKTDVLLVPNAAITTQRGQSYVQVVLPDGTTEEREIQTGISDYQFTEVTEGLSEGEQILVPQGTATTTSTTTNRRPQGGIGFFGPR
jgi:multidrug efflux pump subunit AcrA (membrane-fusion protein)